MKRILFIIILAQFFCTSVWFAGNAVMTEMATAKDLDELYLVYLISAVQFGFIIGTLVFASFAIADRYSPSLVFLFSALFAALFNGLITFNWITGNNILICRFLTGFFLAGIYPVGMKIAADYFEKGLGKSLGFLVGALVLGTAFPHLINGLSIKKSWEFVLYATSVLSILGGLILYVGVKDGPYRKKLGVIQFAAVGKVFRIPALRKSAFGYFGHMWELYTFWTFVPLLLSHKLNSPHYNYPILTFIIIGSGALACFLSGLLSTRFSVHKIALVAVSISSACCLLFPLFFCYASNDLYIFFLVFWGLFVVADSPMFSSLIAVNVPADLRGSTLTMVNSIGFLITILSIQMMGRLLMYLPFYLVWTILAVGPVFALLQLVNRSNKLKL